MYTAPPVANAGSLWGKPNNAAFGSTFSPDQRQSFNQPSNLQPTASSSQFAASPSPFSQTPPQPPRPFQQPMAASNLFGSPSSFDSSVAASSSMPGAPLPPQSYQPNFFAATATHPAPQHGAANPFLNGGGSGSGGGGFGAFPTSSGPVRPAGVGDFPFATQQQQSLPTAGAAVAPPMGRVAGNPFL